MVEDPKKRDALIEKKIQRLLNKRDGINQIGDEVINPKNFVLTNESVSSFSDMSFQEMATKED